MIRIVDMGNNPVKACAEVSYKGYTISVSTILNNCRVGIFKDGEEEVYVDTFEEAIQCVNKKGE
jgi:hypothetical protein